MTGRLGRAEGVSRAWLAGLIAFALSACATTRVSETEFAAVEQAVEGHILVLASDEFGGRRPATDGEARTLAYIRNELERAGYVSGTNDPANPWLAPVDLVRTLSSASEVELSKGNHRFPISPDQAFAATDTRRILVENAELVFIGRRDPSQFSDEIKGRVAILYDVDQKTLGLREAAFSAGATSVLHIVEDRARIASARLARSEERFALAGDVPNQLTAFVAESAFAEVLGEQTWQEWKARMLADEEGFAPIPTGLTARIEAVSLKRDAVSHNLIARLPGAVPNSGAVLLLAHWDHFGECPKRGTPDGICNGAVDNASGISVMIELARRLAANGPHDRDIYVLATTAEEWGLLGAKAFHASPSLPLEGIVAAFNFDSVALAPRGGPVAFVGQGYTDLDQRVLDAIARSGRPLGSQILADRFLRRQDSWALLEHGIPALNVTSGLGNEALLDEFLATRYHQASDNPEGLELGGAVEDLLMHEELVRELASVERYPR